MPTPTVEQARVLASDARIRLVRAVPGSGKTWLIAEAIRRIHQDWRWSHQGIAALSFTNVASDEIRARLGHELSHPHFVGTIDAFLYRYIVRPFARQVNSAWPPPRLIPAESVQHLSPRQSWVAKKLLVQVPGTKYRANLYEFDFTGMGANTPILSVKTIRGREQLSPAESRKIFDQKVKLWHSTGRLSHSDAAYVAAAIVTSGQYGPSIVDLLVRRFPILIVDELQDTGYFRSQALHRLLEHPATTAFLVGDPDQAIFGFNGAHPEIFHEFESHDGTVCFPIEVTQRCPPAVCKVAEALAGEDRKIIPQTAGNPGHAILLPHDGNPEPILAFAARQVAVCNGKVAVVTRRNADVVSLRGGQRREVKKFGTRPIECLARAVRDLRLGRTASAFAGAEACVARVLFKNDSPSAEELEQLGIGSFDWRRAVVEVLLTADQAAKDRTIYSWGCQMTEELVAIMKRRGWWDRLPGLQRPRRPRSETTNSVGWDEYATYSAGSQSVPIQTVHAVKGETHHTTILFVPERGREHCPAQVWWPGKFYDEEERRIAYVAATRPRSTFVLSVHRDALQRLRQAQPEFVRLFDVVELTDLHRIPRQLTTHGGA